jgi:hypothetical protein
MQRRQGANKTGLNHDAPLRKTKFFVTFSDGADYAGHADAWGMPACLLIADRISYSKL